MKNIKWKKEKTFKCSKDAEEAVSLEGIWTKYYYNNVHNGVKSYYRCNQLKLHPKQCSAGILLHYECVSNNVHLYRKEAEHDCKTILRRVLNPNVKKEVQRLFELNLKPKDIFSELSKVIKSELPNKKHIYKYIQCLQKKKSFDSTSTQFEFISIGKYEDKVVDNLTGNTNMSKRKFRNKEKTFQHSKEAEDAVQIESILHTNIQAIQQKNIHDTSVYEYGSSDDNITANTRDSFKLWNKERTFESPKDAEEVLQEEDLWSKQESTFVPEGMKTFYKCNKVKCRLKECHAGIFLLYDSESNRVHLYRKQAEEDHHSEATSSNSFSENIKEEEEMFVLNLKPEVVFSDPLENVAPFEHENTKNSANSIQTDTKNICQDDELLETFSAHIIKRNSYIWNKEKTFVNSKDAEKAVRNEAIWNKYYKNKGKNGLKVYFRCNRVKLHAKQCSAKIFLFYDNVSNCVHLYRKDAEHDHNNEQKPKKRVALNLSDTNSNVTSQNIAVENSSENNITQEIPQEYASDTRLIESFDDAETANQNRARNHIWNKEKTFENLKGAEEAVRLEGVWSRHYKNRVKNGLKIYYRCNQVISSKSSIRYKLLAKQCSARIFLFYDCVSKCVHLYRRDAEHDHNSSISPIVIVMS